MCKILKYDINQYVKKRFQYLMCVSHYIKRVKPNCLYKDINISDCSALFEGMSYKYNIPIVSSMHASLSDKYRNFVYEYADYLTVIGEDHVAPLLKRGFKKEQIVCTGHAVLQDIKAKWTLEKSFSFLEKKYNLNLGEKNILIITSNFDRQNELFWIKKLSEYINSMQEDVRILIKPHIYAGHFYDFCKEYDLCEVLPAECPLYPLFQVSTFCITDVSHAGKLALYFYKMLLIVNFSGKKFLYHTYENDDISLTAHNEDELYRYTKHYLDDDTKIDKNRYDAFIKKYLTSIDDNPARNIAELILSMPNPPQSFQKT